MQDHSFHRGGGFGPDAWCHFCSRRHARRDHPETFQQVERISKAGNKVIRWAHVPVEAKPKRGRARKS